MNSNKWCFAWVSDLIFLPFAQKGETFFHSKSHRFNFWSNLIVKLHIFYHFAFLKATSSYVY